MTPYQAALELSRAGYHLIPVKKGDKAPRHVPWKNWQTKPTPPELIDFWEDRNPGCNWAVVCGRASGLAVIDADTVKASHTSELAAQVKGMLLQKLGE
jgi:hypothetical protein